MNENDMLRFGLPQLNVQNSGVDFSEDILNEENGLDENETIFDLEKEDDI